MSETTTPSEPPPSRAPWAFLALAGLGAVCVLATEGANLLPMGLAATAEEMSGQAEQLQQLMGFFTLAAHSIGERDKAAVARQDSAAPWLGRTGWFRARP
nr:hypothetical protein [uncultured Pseudomonas sp.]